MYIKHIFLTERKILFFTANIFYRTYGYRSAWASDASQGFGTPKKSLFVRKWAKIMLKLQEIKSREIKNTKILWGRTPQRRSPQKLHISTFPFLPFRSWSLHWIVLKKGPGLTLRWGYRLLLWDHRLLPWDHMQIITLGPQIITLGPHADYYLGTTDYYFGTTDYYFGTMHRLLLWDHAQIITLGPCTDYYFGTTDYYFGTTDYYTLGPCTDYYFGTTDYYFGTTDYYLGTTDYYFRTTCRLLPWEHRLLRIFVLYDKFLCFKSAW